MELKDVILSTLAEMENDETTQELQPEKKEPTLQKDFSSSQEKSAEPKSVHITATESESELHYLQSIRERLLVLFEGFQAPNNTNIEAKVDMTLNFLEYILATIDKRVEKLEKEEH